MADSSKKSNRKKFTITATEAGIQIAEKALIRLGFETKTNFAKSYYISRSTVTKFFGRKPIQLDTFKKICQELKLNWREIAGIEEAKKTQLKTVAIKTPDTDEEVKQMESSSSRQVTIIEPSSGTIKAEITLAGDINSVSNLKIIETILQAHSGNTIKIIDTRDGSIKLTIEGSPEDIEKLVPLIKSGELTQIDGFPVEDIQVLIEDSEEKESRGISNKLIRKTIYPKDRLKGVQIINQFIIFATRIISFNRQQKQPNNVYSKFEVDGYNNIKVNGRNNLVAGRYFTIEQSFKVWY